MPVTINGSGLASGVTSVPNLATFPAGPRLAKVNMPAGNILQVINVSYGSVFTTTSQSFVSVTGMSATITPSSTSNKILIFWSVNGVTTSTGNGNNEGSILITDGTNNYGVMDGAVTNYGGSNYTTNPVQCYSGTAYIAPASTSPITYTMNAKCSSASYGIAINNYWNNTYNTTSMTLMEIAQ